MPDQFDAALSAFVESLHGDADMDVEAAMTRIVEFTMATAEVADGSIFFAHPTSAGLLYDTVAPTSAEAVKIDEIQHEVGHGPSIDAVATGATVLSRDLARDERWPGWRDSAVEFGISGVISVRLHARARTIGALNLYARRADALDENRARAVEVLAKHAAAALAAAMDHATLTRALLTRSTIGRAQGVMMERYGLDDGAAFEVLKRHSQASNTKLRHVAERILDGHDLDTIIDPTERRA
jgi:GAF domain-containing protein